MNGIPDPGRASRAVEQIVASASPFDNARTPCPQGGEDRWSARWLMEQMGYSAWQKFEPIIERAKTAAHNEGFNVRTLFTQTVEKSGGRPQTDYLVTRFAAYLIAMNGHPGKPEVSAAQTYFAVKTRQAEVAAPALTEDEIVHQALSITARRVEALTALVAEMEPKAAAYERFMEADGTYAVGSVAKMLGTSQNKLFLELRARGVFIAKGAMRNTPYQRYMQHFDVKPHDFERTDGTAGTSYTTRVRPSGLEFIARKLGQELRYPAEVV